MTTDELPVLRALRLKGRATTEDLAEATGLRAGSVTAATDALVASGGAKEMRGAYVLLPPARDRLDQLLAAERARVDQAAIAELYEQFSEVNGDFKALANDWQTRGDAVNDHTDAAYDEEVLARLPQIHARVNRIVDRVALQAPHRQVWRSSFDGARARGGRRARMAAEAADRQLPHGLVRAA